MYKSYKIRLLPTKEQELKMFETINVCRFTYNFGLDYCMKYSKKLCKVLKMIGLFIIGAWNVPYAYSIFREWCEIIVDYDAGCRVSAFKVSDSKVISQISERVPSLNGTLPKP